MSFSESLEAARSAWQEKMKDHQHELGWVQFDSPPRLKAEHIRGAQLFADRFDLVASLQGGGCIAEIGVLKGEFSEYILRTNKPRELHLFDLDFDRFDVKARLNALDTDATLVFHRGDSSPNMRDLPDQTFDWIYIDAGHDYDSVQADALASIPKLKPGGHLVFNDYIFWSHTECRPYGVIQVVNELVTEQDWRVSALALAPQMYCDIAITRIDCS